MEVDGKHLSHVTTFFIGEFQLLYKEGGDISQKFFSQGKCHWNLNKQTTILREFYPT